MQCGPWINRAALLLLLALAPAVGQPRPSAAAPPAAAPADAQEVTAREAPETERPAGSKFLRITRSEQDEPISLDTAIVRYVSTDPALAGVTVDLVGVIHIGEKDYYDELNRVLAEYDAVLYELVAPEGTKIEKGETRSAHPISALQGGMKSMLGLELQLEHIDYQKDHFVHADMTPEGFSKSMEDRGENMFTLFFRMLGQSIAQQSKLQARQAGQPNVRRGANDADMLLAMFDRNRSHKLKQLMAEQFEDLEGAMGMFEGPNGSTIITERNKVALDVVRKQLAGGKRKLAVFYGAGHMPDMERRLLADFGLRRDSERWLAAWQLEPKKKGAKSDGE
ncbi:MAG: hypothetical protein JNG90_17460 [Planctomycetaceae bacterium]|nr:hypothetical protein [Planctomycetaceae bacterium]